MAKNDGDQRVLATAQHIVRTLGKNDEATEDMIRILSTFDDRFSSMNKLINENQDSATSSITSALKNMKETLEQSEEIIMMWENKNTMIWDNQSHEADSYVNAVDQLYTLTRAPRNDKSLRNRAQHALDIAISRLKEEFRYVLVMNSEAVDGGWLLSCMNESGHSNEQDDLSGLNIDSSDDEKFENEDIPIAHPVTEFDASFDPIPPERIRDLNMIAHCMARIGVIGECSQVYVNVRKTVLHQSLYRLGLEKPNAEILQKMNWDMLEVKIRKWMQSFKVAVKVVFRAEKRLCDHVFIGLNNEGETSFTDLASSSFLQFLLFAHIVTMTRRTPEKLFKILDMYELIKELMPEISNIFQSESVLSEAKGVASQIGEVARGILQEFEIAIQKDAAKNPVSGGNFHGLTRYVMNYIKLLVVYSSSLEHLLRGKKREIPRSLGVETFGLSEGLRSTAANESESSLAIQVMWLIVHLERNLEEKSKLYSDPSMGFLFLMNNVHYIVHKVRQSELVSLLGDGWIRKHSGQVRVYAAIYIETAWQKVFSCLKEEGLVSNGRSGSSSGIATFAIKDRFKKFNLTFEEVHASQSNAIVPNLQLREELRLAIAEKLLPLYRTFLERFGNHLETGKQPEKFLKYSYDDLENHIIDLFDGHQ